MDNTNLRNKLENKMQTLVPVSDYTALHTNALEIIQDNLRNQPLTAQLFDMVKSPSGGATAFTVPGLSGETVEKELTGIILTYTTPRAYWNTPDPVEGTPPDCMSGDSIVSSDGKPCYQCPFNDFGSKDGSSLAKACKEMVMLYLLRPGSIVPLLVRVPVSSKVTFLKYATRLLSTLTPLCGVETKITLEKATSSGGKPYAKYHFEAVRLLDAEEVKQAKAFGQQFMELVNNQTRQAS